MEDDEELLAVEDSVSLGSGKLSKHSEGSCCSSKDSNQMMSEDSDDDSDGQSDDRKCEKIEDQKRKDMEEFAKQNGFDLKYEKKKP